MKDDTQLGDRVHPAALMYAEEVAAGKLSRREFLTRSSALGVSAVAAYGLLGLPAPAMAQDTPVAGGTLLLDFGAARRVVGEATQQLTAVLKSGYSPVEQYEGDDALRQALLQRAGWEAARDAGVSVFSACSRRLHGAERVRRSRVAGKDAVMT